MNYSRAISLIGVASAAITAALTVPGFIPVDYAPWVMLGSAALAATGKRLIETKALNKLPLTICLVLMALASVVAGATDLVGSRWATMGAGVSAVALAFARSVFGWNEEEKEPEFPRIRSRPKWED